MRRSLGKFADLILKTKAISYALDVRSVRGNIRQSFGCALPQYRQVNAPPRRFEDVGAAKKAFRM